MINIIEGYLKFHISSILRCFIINNSIIIETNYKELYQDFKRYFEPYYSVEFNSLLEEKNFKIKAFTLDELRLINLFDSLEGGVETFQFLGYPNKKLKWCTKSEDNYIISYNSYFRSIVVQDKKNINNLLIISSKLLIGKVLGKIIREEILYNDPLKLTLNSSLIINHSNNGILFLGKSANFYSSVFEFIKLNSPVFVTLSKAIIHLENQDVFAEGTPELLTVENTNNRVTNNYSYRTDDPYKISPKDFANIFNLVLCKKTRINTIIFECNEPHVKKLNKFEVKDNLQKYIVQNEPSALSPWLPINVGKNSSNICNILENVVNVPSLSMNFEKLSIEKFTEFIRVKN